MKRGAAQMTTKTYLPEIKKIQRNWHFIDANGKVLGRLATVVANILRGKNKAFYTPNIDCGDFVVITNAAKVVLTGNKLEQKIDYTHSGYSGGDRHTKYKDLMATKPERAVKIAVKGMLPHNRLADRQIVRLKIFKGAEHTHSAQFANRVSK